MKLREERVGDGVVVRCEEIEWLAANREWLERDHLGEWVAVEGAN